jgi:hypothetical protein
MVCQQQQASRRLCSCDVEAIIVLMHAVVTTTYNHGKELLILPQYFCTECNIGWLDAVMQICTAADAQQLMHSS